MTPATTQEQPTAAETIDQRLVAMARLHQQSNGDLAALLYEAWDVISWLRAQEWMAATPPVQAPAAGVGEITKRLLRYADDLDCTDRPAIDEYDVTADIRQLVKHVEELEMIRINLRLRGQWPEDDDTRALADREAAAREDENEQCATTALEQRCERGTPWDLACLAIAREIRARTPARPEKG